jgi:hypothetical protein
MLSLRIDKSAELRRKFISLNSVLFSYYIVYLFKEIYILDLS